MSIFCAQFRLYSINIPTISKGNCIFRRDIMQALVLLLKSVCLKIIYKLLYFSTVSGLLTVSFHWSILDTVTPDMWTLNTPCVVFIAQRYMFWSFFFICDIIELLHCSFTTYLLRWLLEIVITFCFISDVIYVKTSPLTRKHVAFPMSMM